MTLKDIEVRGRKEITEFLGVREWRTAKKRLKRLGLLTYEGNKPVLNIEAYRIVSVQNHITTE